MLLMRLRRLRRALDTICCPLRDGSDEVNLAAMDCCRAVRVQTEKEMTPRPTSTLRESLHAETLLAMRLLSLKAFFQTIADVLGTDTKDLESELRAAISAACVIRAEMCLALEMDDDVSGDVISSEPLEQTAARHRSRIDAVEQELSRHRVVSCSKASDTCRDECHNCNVFAIGPANAVRVKNHVLRVLEAALREDADRCPLLGNGRPRPSLASPAPESHEVEEKGAAAPVQIAHASTVAAAPVPRQEMHVLPGQFSAQRALSESAPSAADPTLRVEEGCDLVLAGESTVESSRIENTLHFAII